MFVKVSRCFKVTLAKKKEKKTPGISSGILTRLTSKSHIFFSFFSFGIPSRATLLLSVDSNMVVVFVCI